MMCETDVQIGKFRLIVFQIGLQYLTTMDHHMKESFYD